MIDVGVPQGGWNILYDDVLNAELNIGTTTTVFVEDPVLVIEVHDKEDLLLS